MKRWMGVALLALVAGCGVETVGTAAVQASLKEREAEEARRIQEDALKQMEAAQQLQQQRLEEVVRTADQASQ
jgi:NifU-like protein involved in Fe-S cluster formation